MNKIASIQYFEKPVTADEKEIAGLLQKIIKAVTDKNINLLISAYSDAASINNLTSRDTPLNKEEYRENMLKIIGNIRNVYFHDAIIRVNGQEAAISCVSSILLQDSASPVKNRRYYKCIREAGEWRIKESLYIVF